MNEFARHLNEIERREFLRKVAKSSLGVSVLPGLAYGEGRSITSPKNATAKNVIFLYMAGGMTHVDTFDPKTNSEVKGKTTPIKTKADGLQVSNLLPNLAKQADKFSIVRGMSTKTGDHAGGNYLMHTSYNRRPGTNHPHMGSWAQYFLGRRTKSMPDSVIVGGGNPGPGFFPPDHSPFPIGDPSKGINDVLPKISEEKFAHRVEMAQKFSEIFEQAFPHDEVKSYADFYDETVKFFDSETVAAFDINKEPKAVRDRYGNDRFARGLLLARRLVEHKVRYVEVQLGGWDGQHNGLDVAANQAGKLDAPLATFLDDLNSKGLLDETMVVLCSEFGRTPKISKRGGRDHFPKAFSIMMAGGGITGGHVVSKTDDKAMNVVGEKYEPKDMHTTIAKALGLPIDKRIHGSGGRPFFVGDRGKVITELFA